jgi:hypothetical protein
MNYLRKHMSNSKGTKIKLFGVSAGATLASYMHGSIQKLQICS